MRIILLFVYLCIFLLNGYNPVRGVVPSPVTGYTHFQYIQTSKLVTSNFNRNNSTRLANDNTSNQKEYFIVEEAEDEDSNNSIARKFKSPDKTYSALSYQFFSGYPANRSKVAPSFCGRISYKYILQRVLKV